MAMVVMPCTYQLGTANKWRLAISFVVQPHYIRNLQDGVGAIDRLLCQKLNPISALYSLSL